MLKRIRYLSDLHLEYHGYPSEVIPSIEEDLVILAGDIGHGVEGVRWAKQAFSGRPVVYVLGNHEFHGYDWLDLIEASKALADGSNVTVLECDQIEIAGLRVLGCSLWTDFKLFGEQRQAEMLQFALSYSDDYEEIRHPSGRSLLPSETLERCNRSHVWLQGALSERDVPNLVVTHHAPSLATVSPRHAGHPSNATFHNHFDALLAPPCVGWIHGHTHYSCETVINGVPLVTNQRGYPREKNAHFAWDRVLEVEVAS